MKTALIWGITGQDGSYLSELLLAKGYCVHGVIRRSSSFNTGRIEHILSDLHLHHGDITDSSNIARLLLKVQPDEIYNLAAQSHVRVSFDCPEYTGDVVALGATRILESIRELGMKPRYYQASSSEMYGAVATVPQNENTIFRPQSPYGAAKLYAYWVTRNYRDAYGLHASNGILFNHESPRRGETFVTRKITRAVAAIVQGRQKELRLGNLEARRDWGHARDYVDAMWRMLQQHIPDDYVICTGVTHSVRQFANMAFAHVGLNYNDYVIEDSKYFRPTEVHMLQGCYKRAANVLGWHPQCALQQLVAEMVEHDLKHES